MYSKRKTLKRKKKVDNYTGISHRKHYYSNKKKIDLQSTPLSIFTIKSRGFFVFIFKNIVQCTTNAKENNYQGRLSKHLLGMKVFSVRAQAGQSSCYYYLPCRQSLYLQYYTFSFTKHYLMPAKRNHRQSSCVNQPK